MAEGGAYASIGLGLAMLALQVTTVSIRRNLGIAYSHPKINSVSTAVQDLMMLSADPSRGPCTCRLVQGLRV